MVEKKNKVFAYVESPLQYLSAISLSSLMDINLILYRGVFLKKNNDKSDNNESVNKLFNLTKITDLLKFIILKKEKCETLCIGDLRSLYSSILITVLRPRNVTLLDDGMYTLYVDSMNSLNDVEFFYNTRYIIVKKALKSVWPKIILNRASFFWYGKSSGLYNSYLKQDYIHILKSITIPQDVNNFSNKKTIFIHSSMSNIISTKDECSIYESIKLKNKNILAIMHRNCSEHDKKLLSNAFGKENLVSLQHPIEAYLMGSESVCEIITTVSTSAVIVEDYFSEKFNLSIIIPNISRVNVKHKKFIGWFVGFIKSKGFSCFFKEVNSEFYKKNN